MEIKSKRDEIIELVSKLFIYTDYQQWDKLLAEVFKETVHFNMESAGGGPANDLKAIEICRAWKEGFAGLDAVHHQAGNFLVDFKKEENTAHVFCYATASHFKSSAVKNKIREFVGGYDLHVVLTDEGWRIDRFIYNLKYINGVIE